MRTLLNIFFDGSFDNNAKLQFMGIGVAVFIGEQYQDSLSTCKMVGTSGTNNIAEWEALQLALQTAIKLLSEGTVDPSSTSIRFYGDSQIIVKQFNGLYSIKQAHFLPYYHECKALSRQLQVHQGLWKGVHWIPREANIEADRLSKKAVIDFIDNK